MSENDPGAPKSELPPPLDTLEPRQLLPRTPERDPAKFRGEAFPALDVKSPKVAEYLDVGLSVDDVPKGASPPSLEFLRAMKCVCESEGLEMKPELLQRLNRLEDQERRRSQPAENSISPSEREARIARIRELQRRPLPMPPHLAAMLSEAVLRKK